jgi:hypothetical protein
MRSLALAFLMTVPLLAGCADDGGDDPADDPVDTGVDTIPTLEGFTGLPAVDLPVFSAPFLIDDVRAGGEPVIAITKAGTILISAHPGFTHYHPSDESGHVGTEIASEFAGQSYMWRSTDNGTSWTHIGLPMLENGPRSLGLGVSDPEFTVMEDGTICFTDLEALAQSSTSCSTDDGQTWLVGNPVASGGPTDRQWLASYGDEFYFTANYFTDHHIRASTDRGMTWERRGDVPCSQDIIANPNNGHIIVGCDAGIAVSEDAGFTWQERPIPNGTGSNRMAEPAIDSAGNIWITYAEGERRLWAAGTPDEGQTWPWIIDITPHFRLFSERANGTEMGSNGTYVWPWISAGSDGRFAVSWIGLYTEEDSEDSFAGWYIFTAYVIGGNTPQPTVAVSQWTPDPIHVGPICQGGTGCQVTSMQGDDSGDRRLGDFFETTVGPDGYLYGTWSNTNKRSQDVISHPEFSRQTGGIRLIADEELGSFFPTQG